VHELLRLFSAGFSAFFAAIADRTKRKFMSAAGGMKKILEVVSKPQIRFKGPAAAGLHI